MKLLIQNVRGYGDSTPLAEPGIDRCRHLAARFDVARGDDHVRPVLGHALDNGAADAARRAGNYRRFPREVKERQGAVLSIALYLFCRRAYSRCGKPASEEDVQ